MRSLSASVQLSTAALQFATASSCTTRTARSIISAATAHTSTSLILSSPNTPAAVRSGLTMSNSTSETTAALSSPEVVPFRSKASSALPAQPDQLLPVQPVSPDPQARQVLLEPALSGQPVLPETQALQVLSELDLLVLGTLEPPVRLGTPDPSVPDRPGSPGLRALPVRPDLSVSLAQAEARQARQELGQLVLPDERDLLGRKVLLDLKAFRDQRVRKGL